MVSNMGRKSLSYKPWPWFCWRSPSSGPRSTRLRSSCITPSQLEHLQDSRKPLWSLHKHSRSCAAQGAGPFVLSLVSDTTDLGEIDVSTVPTSLHLDERPHQFVFHCDSSSWYMPEVKNVENLGSLAIQQLLLDWEYTTPEHWQRPSASLLGLKNIHPTDSSTLCNFFIVKNSGLLFIFLAIFNSITFLYLLLVLLNPPRPLHVGLFGLCCSSGTKQN